MNRLNLICFALFFHLSSYAGNPSLPVDISFLVADLKYNEEQGVKLCELQQGHESLFQGFDFLENRRGVLGERLCTLLDKSHNHFWFIPKDVNFTPMILRFLHAHWIPIKGLNALKSSVPSPSIDSPLISHYRGILYANPSRIDNLQMFHLRYPGVILINAANFSFRGDKLLMSTLFRGSEVLESVKPRWGSYPKEYSKGLSKRIIEEIDSDLLVIKPRCFAEGKGVILLMKEDLDQTLAMILGNRALLQKNPDPSYKFWAVDCQNSFIVEEYVPSVPVYVPHFSNLPFNGTMRVVIVLIYDNWETQIHFLGGYWILPEKSLIETGTFHEKNKSCPHPPHYWEVDTDIMQRVEHQLTPALHLLYEKMLGGEGFGRF